MPHAPSPMPPAPRRRILRPEDWPAADRAAWEALFAGGDILDGAGPARHWSPATRRTNAEHYGRWLGWLAREGRLDPACPPAGRIEREAVHAFARDLLARVAPRTAASALIGLKVVAKAMAPGQGWRWLRDLANRLNARARPSQDPRAALPPLGEIHRAALDALDRLRATPLARRIDRVAFRDTLMVAILSACPVRLANLAGLETGRSLRREDGRWAIRLDEAETKTRQRLAYLLPRHLDPCMAVYLERVRPSFGPGEGCARLWPGVAGGPLADHSVYCRIVLVTERLLGAPINPHAFRSAAATSLVEDAPEAAHLAGPLLGHRSFRTTERHYIRAGQIAASRRVSAVLAEIAREAQGKGERDAPDGTDPTEDANDTGRTEGNRR